MTNEEREAYVGECRASGQSARSWYQEHGTTHATYATYVTWAKRFPNVDSVTEPSAEPTQQWVAVTEVKKEMPI